MLNDKLQPFYEAVQIAIAKVGNSAPRIADKVIGDVFPDTSHAADREGATTMLRTGVIAFLTNYLKKHAKTPLEQHDFSDIADDFRGIAEKLSSHSHYVPSLQQHMPLGYLIRNPGSLDEARKFKRLKGLETLAEADALDELYEAVLAQRGEC